MMTNLIGEAGDESDNDSSTVSTDVCESISEAPLAEEHVSAAQDHINTSLVEAAKQGDYIAIKAHLDAGGSPNIRGAYNHEVALIEAARYRHYAIVESLLDSDANPDIQNTYHQTPLMWAVKEGHNDIATLLLDNGANPTIKNDNDETALLWAAEASNIAGIKLLAAKGVNIVKDGKIFIADMMGDNFLLGAHPKVKTWLNTHKVKLEQIAIQMTEWHRFDEHNILSDANRDMFLEAKKYSRTDVINILKRESGATDNQASIIYDQAMNDARRAEENFARPTKRARR